MINFEENNNIAELINYYLSLDIKKESILSNKIFKEIIEALNIDYKGFNKNRIDDLAKRTIIESLYYIKEENYKVIAKPLENLLLIINDNKDLEDESFNNIINDYCSILKLMIRRKNDVKVK